MLSAVRPLLTDTVEHWLAPTRNIHGKVEKIQSTPHLARVVRMGGELVMPASHEKVANARAVVWLIDHPREIAVGDTFQLFPCEVLTVARVELRTTRGGSLSKVYLK